MDNLRPEAINLNSDNYKGIYFNNPEADNHFIDPITGAHFQYTSMVRKLLVVQNIRKDIEIAQQNTKADHQNSEYIAKKANAHLKLKEISNNSRSKSYDKVNRYSKLQKILKEDIENGRNMQLKKNYITCDPNDHKSALPTIKPIHFPEIPESFVNRSNSNVLKLKAITRNSNNNYSGVSGSFIKGLDHLRLKKSKGTIHESFIEDSIGSLNSDLSKARIRVSTINRSNIIRNLHLAKNEKSRNKERYITNPGIVRLSKITVDSSTINGTKDKIKNSERKEKIKITLADYPYRHLLDGKDLINRTSIN